MHNIKIQLTTNDTDEEKMASVEWSLGDRHSTFIIWIISKSLKARTSQEKCEENPRTSQR